MFNLNDFCLASHSNEGVCLLLVLSNHSFLFVASLDATVLKMFIWKKSARANNAAKFTDKIAVSLFRLKSDREALGDSGESGASFGLGVSLDGDMW